MFGLDALLSPFDSEEFIQSHWGKKALYVPGEASKFEGLYNWGAVNDLLNTRRNNYDGCLLVNKKKVLPPHAFKRMDHWLKEGATLVVNNVNKIDPLVGKFASFLGNELNTHVNVNSYMSYPAKQGFDNHFDKHDVFIVQTEGEKDWVVFEPTKTYPLHKQNEDMGDPPNVEPYLQCRLSPGDMIYIPRGHWHYAVAVSPSIHLTVGPESRSASEFLLWWANQLMQDDEEFYRIDFPIARSALIGGSRAPEFVASHMDEFRQRMVTLIQDEPFMNELLMRYCMATNPLARDYELPHAWADNTQISKQTNLIVPIDQKFIVHYDDEINAALIILRGNKLTLNAIPREVLGEILNGQGEKMINGELLMQQFSTLEWSDLQTWLYEMMRAGLLILPS